MRRQREHSFQAWCDRFIDKVVLPPMFTTGIDHAARDMHKIGRVMAMKARGVRFGVPDVYVAQAGRSVWLELKRGTTLSTSQYAVHEAMKAAGQPVYVCTTIAEVLAALRSAGLSLHGNADNLAVEYEARVQASETEEKPKKVSVRPPVKKAAAGRVRKTAKIRSEVLF